ncbi:hypothetical protein [Curtobacterium sp. MCBD17_021]|uniref:hypothetical protein n=1 Tax=Curtobacterium sp. MCBD17_021 TaxID=2175665 RepID=UPI0011B5FF22|nr:hypothetical protein [Curtobacterium sp. MCBD17_021]
MSAGRARAQIESKTPASSGNSSGGINQNEGCEPDMDNTTRNGEPVTAAIEVVGSRNGRERRAVLHVGGEVTADGARRIAVRLLEAAQRIDRA